MASSSVIQSIEVDCDSKDDLSQKVFENDLLREIIIDYCLQNKASLHLRKCLKIVREVHPSWLRTATKLMRRYRQPVLIVTLNKNNSSVDGEYFKKNGEKHLDRVMRYISDQIPQYPFSLKISADYFNTDNCRSLAAWLANVGHNLVGLDMAVPHGSGNFLSMKSLKLPYLQRIAIHITVCRLESPPSTTFGSHHGQPSGFQFLLNGSTELKQVVLDGALLSMVRLPRPHFIIPESVRNIYLDMPLESVDLRKVLYNHLPNLKALRLYASERPYEEELIYGILEKYKDQLTSLSLIGKKINGPVIRTTLISRLPVMRSLQFLWLGNQRWELQHGLENLQACLPALKEMTMTDTRWGIFTNWTTNSVYPSVKSVVVSLVRSHPLSLRDVPLTLCFQKMQMLHISYPNIVSLEISSSCGGLMLMSGLKYIFLEMRNLTRLIILLQGNNHLPANCWDPLLIGASATRIDSLRRHPRLWPTFIANQKNDIPSIRKLTHLKVLAINERLSPRVGAPPLISDMAFHLGFLHMENLKLLALNGLFTPSDEIRTLWCKSKGKKICCNDHCIELLKRTRMNR